MTTTGDTRWLFADQLGPHFSDGQPELLIISRGAFRRRRLHRAKALLLLSAVLHRAQHDHTELVIADSYRDGLSRATNRPDHVIAPTSHAARTLVGDLGLHMLPSRGFVTSEDRFRQWAEGKTRVRLEDFYRDARRRTGVLMGDDGQPVGERWNFDADNRLPPPKTDSLGLTTTFPREDDIDAQAREMLGVWEDEGWLQLRGQDGPRQFAVTRAEARAVLADFVTHRLPTFGPYEDAALRADWVMAHSLLSVPMNLGLLDPAEVIAAVVDAYSAGHAPLASVEGFVRQVMGWREFVWHLYWWFGPQYRHNNHLAATTPLPEWFDQLDGDQVTAACLSESLADVSARGWAHHIIRLEILGNWALQQGYHPAEVNDWFTEVFVDGYSWVMPANVIGMALYADGGAMSTKPYAAGGAYINRMTDFCGGCAYRPSIRVGERACPFTAGYWAFLHRNAAQLSSNHRMAQPYANMRRLADLPALLTQEQQRTGPP